MRLSSSDPGQQPAQEVATREAVWAKEAVISPPSSRVEQMNKIFGYLKEEGERRETHWISSEPKRLT